MWQQLDRVVKLNGAVVMTAIQPFTTALIHSNIRNFSYCWIWYKIKGANFQLCKKQPLRTTEDVVVFYRKFPTYNPQGLTKLETPIVQSNKNKAGLLGHLSWIGDKQEFYEQEWTNYPRNVLKFKLDQKEGVHPTQKPVKLLAYLIKTYTNKGDTVLDFTMGSGSTGVACVKTGRKFIGIELDRSYFNISKDRIQQAAIDLRGGPLAYTQENIQRAKLREVMFELF